MVRDLVVAGVVAMVAISAPARAEYPDRPVRLIVPFGSFAVVADVVPGTAFQDIAQFSILSLGTRANSKVLAVISTAPRRRA
jgi:hypothetical protein